MNLLDDVPLGVRVGLDTPPFIYYLEWHAFFEPIIRPLFEDRIQQRLNPGVTSVVSLAELLVYPFRMGRQDLLQRHRDFMTKTPNLSLVPIVQSTAERAAELRARYAFLGSADALQIAAALEHGATHFVTNDDDLRTVTDLQVLVLKDYLPASTP